MTSYERYERIRKNVGLSNADVSRGTGVADTTISAWKKGTYTPKADKIQKIADYLGVPLSVLMGEDEPKYYLNEETARIAQEIFEDPNQRILFDASRDLQPDEVLLLAEIAKKMKATNPDG